MDYPHSEDDVGLAGGKFTDGNPLLGIPASRDPASWANAVTDEIRNVIIEGDLVPAEANHTQLRDAVKAIAVKALRAVTSKATEVLLGVLRVGTQVEVDAGTLDDVAVTPKKLRWGFTASWGTNGYIIFPSWMLSFILQWGSATTDANGACTYTFTIPFPNSAWNPLGSVGATSRVVASLVMETPSLTSCRAWVSNSSGTAFASASVRFWVLGR